MEKAKNANITKQVLGALAFVLAFEAATERLAYQFNFQSALGDHYNKVYAPWKIVEWWFEFGGDYSRYFVDAVSAGALVLATCSLFLMLYLISSKNSSNAISTLHGSSRFAEKKDIKLMGLLQDDGVVVGGWVDKSGGFHYLRHNGPEHIATFASTRSGKGVGLVLPTLLTWLHSVFINDIKGELYALTSGWRKQGANNYILKFEPGEVGSVKWNPLNEIRVDEGREVGDVQNLTTLIVDPDGEGLKDHWQKTSQSLLVGVILHVIYKSKNEGSPCNLAYVDESLAPIDTDVRSLWLEMTQYPHINGKTSRAVASAARDMLNRPDDEAGSVLSTAKSFLSLYRDPIVSQNISQSDFYIKDLVNSDKPASLYIVTSPADKARMRPLVRILINSIMRGLSDKLDYEYSGGVVKQKRAHKHRILGLLDEFPSLGRLGIIEDAIAHTAGYGIKLYLICQDIRQLKNKAHGYGDDETITSNCHIQNAFATTNVETAEYLSKLSGETTIVKEEITTSGKRQGFAHTNVSRRLHEVKRRLLTPDECLRLPGAIKNGDLIKEAGDMLISVSGKPIIYGKQPLYFKDKVLLERSSIPFPKQSDVIRKSFALNDNEKVVLHEAV